MSKYKPTWESLQQYEAPQWFSDMKFGIFIHWGLYSIPGKGCWYGYWMYRPEHGGKKFEEHVERYGLPSEFGYKDFIPMFTAENFDPYQWMSLVEKSGAKFVMPVTDFHDAFAMYNSDLTEYTAVKMGPKRNIIEELRCEALQRDIKFCVSSHLAFNPIYFTKSQQWDNWDDSYLQLYGPQVEYGFSEQGSPEVRSVPTSWVDYWYERTIELIDKTEPDQLWFDFGIWRGEYLEAKKKIASYYYNKAHQWGKEVVLAYKNHNGEIYPEGTAVLDLERGVLDSIRPMVWQTDTSVGYKDWSYNVDEEFKSIPYLIGEFVDIVSKNGCLLLNIGPDPSGNIPEQAQAILLAFGKWLDMNGEAIYKTRPWAVYGEGPTKLAGGHMNELENKHIKWTSKDIRFTQNGDSLFAIFLDWPGSGRHQIKTIHPHSFLGKKVKSVELLGHGQVNYTLDKFGFYVEMPDKAPCDHAVSIKINLKR